MPLPVLWLTMKEVIYHAISLVAVIFCKHEVITPRLFYLLFRVLSQYNKLLPDSSKKANSEESFVTEFL